VVVFRCRIPRRARTSHLRHCEADVVDGRHAVPLRQQSGIADEMLDEVSDLNEWHRSWPVARGSEPDRCNNTSRSAGTDDIVGWRFDRRVKQSGHPVARRLEDQQRNRAFDRAQARARAPPG